MNDGFKTSSSWMGGAAGLCVRLKDMSITLTASRRFLRALLRLLAVLAAMELIILKMLCLCELVYYYWFNFLLCHLVSYFGYTINFCYKHAITLVLLVFHKQRKDNNDSFPAKYHLSTAVKSRKPQWNLQSGSAAVWCSLMLVLWLVWNKRDYISSLSSDIFFLRLS